MSDKRAIIYFYLYIRKAMDNTTSFSINELCNWSKVKPNTHKGKINDKYVEILKAFANNNYFIKYPDFLTFDSGGINSNDYYNVELNMSKFNTNNNFGIVFLHEVLKIINYKEELKNTDINISRISSAQLLLLLSYIRVNLNRNKKQPLCCYRHYKKISEDIGLSNKYVVRCVEILNALKIIKFAEMKRIQFTDTKKYFTTPKIFANYTNYIINKEGNFVLDKTYSVIAEINRQKQILNTS